MAHKYSWVSSNPNWHKTELGRRTLAGIRKILNKYWDLSDEQLILVLNGEGNEKQNRPIPSTDGKDQTQPR